MNDGPADRAHWVSWAERIARPVLTALARRKLRKIMPIEVGPDGTRDERATYTHLEALGRTLAGIAPWLELPSDQTPEGRLRNELSDHACRAIDAATDPNSPDRMNFDRGGQPLVDAAFLAHGLLRAPKHLWEPLPERVRTNLLAALRSTRVIRPIENNWLLFAAMIEAFLHRAGESWEPDRVAHAIEAHQKWYVGDGTYGDGPSFHWDYYNSFVIHPMLLDVLDVLGPERPDWERLRPVTLARARRYAAVQERLISPEGTFPPIGRSLAYRIGVFQLLGQIALRRALPEQVAPAQVRCALTAVYRRMMDAAGVFYPDGWLTIGFAGHQPFIADPYISTGSLYLCAAGLLPLGLPPSDPFWSDPPTDWTSKRLWSGGEAPRDHAL